MAFVPTVKLSGTLAVAAAVILLFGIAFASKMLPCAFSTNRIRVITAIQRMFKRLTFHTA